MKEFRKRMRVCFKSEKLNLLVRFFNYYNTFGWSRTNDWKAWKSSTTIFSSPIHTHQTNTTTVSLPFFVPLWHFLPQHYKVYVNIIDIDSILYKICKFFNSHRGSTSSNWQWSLLDLCTTTNGIVILLCLVECFVPGKVSVIFNKRRKNENSLFSLLNIFFSLIATASYFETILHKSKEFCRTIFPHHHWKIRSTQVFAMCVCIFSHFFTYSRPPRTTLLKSYYRTTFAHSFIVN